MKNFNARAIIVTPRSKSWAKTRQTIFRSLRLVDPFFAQFTLLANPKILCFTMLFYWPDTPKVPLAVGVSTLPCSTYIFPGSNQLNIPKCISIGSAIFAQLTAEIPVLYNTH